MKNNIFTLFFILTSGFVFAQVNTENGQRGKIKYSDKSILKSADTKKPEVSKPVVVEETEPVIIQRLEYKSEESSSTNKEVKIEDATPVVSKEKEIEPEKTIDEQIEILDLHINSIDTKVNIVKNDSEQDKIAKEKGWYKQMEQNRNNAIEKKTQLINSKK